MTELLMLLRETAKEFISKGRCLHFVVCVFYSHLRKCLLFPVPVVHVRFSYLHLRAGSCHLPAA